jgi:hypothetical protein
LETREQVDAIIVKRLETTPPGETHWSTRSMAKTAGVSHTMVGRIWRTFRLQPHRTESFNGKFRDECLSLEWFRTRPEATAVIERREAIGGLRSLAASRRTDHLRRRDEGHHENRAP